MTSLTRQFCVFWPLVHRAALKNPDIPDRPQRRLHLLFKSKHKSQTDSNTNVHIFKEIVMCFIFQDLMNRKFNTSGPLRSKTAEKFNKQLRELVTIYLTSKNTSATAAAGF